MREARLALFFFCSALVTFSCSSDPPTAGEATSTEATTTPAGGDVGATPSGPQPTAPVDPPGPLSPERAVVAKLGLPPRLLIGLGNDLPTQGFDYTKCDIYGLPNKLDLHYVYLSGLKGQGGWPDDNPGGTYVNLHADAAAAKGIVPMFTLYQAAAWGEEDWQALQNRDFMVPYWQGAKLLFERLAAFGKPAVVHFEPDLWGFAQQHSTGDDPRTVKVKVGSVLPECSGLAEDIAGMGKCLVRLARTIAPKVVVGFQASTFGAPNAQRVAQFLTKVGADEADITVVETLDRDAGCFEARTDPECQRQDGTYYWDETNTKSPSFKDHLAWAKTIRAGVGKPLLWWQTPLGVPKGAPGGSSGRYRDNRVKYMFSHPDEFVAAGGIGIAFGVGAPNQTTVRTDGGQFKNAIAGYFAAPVALP